MIYVLVMLQPMSEDPPEEFKCKDKFLVQSVAFDPPADFKYDDAKDIVRS
jgi:hypothetical protein